MGCTGIFLVDPSVMPASLVTRCPNATTSQVSAASSFPAYRYTRGCTLSFDGTPLVYNLFEPTDASSSHPVYTILEGPGFENPGSTTPDPNLIAGGYAELTWDPRGQGESGGEVEFDSPAYEGRDVSALINMLSTRPEIARDDPGSIIDGSAQPAYANDTALSNTYGQPVIGMAGGSYGGGIQLAAASDDARIKAIVPSWAWNNFNYAAWPNNVFKIGWDEGVFAGGLVLGGAEEHVRGDVQSAPTLGGTAGIQTGDGYDPAVYKAEASALVLGYPDADTVAWFYRRSMADFGTVHPITVPTLLMQGTVDSLLNLNNAWANYEEIRSVDPNAIVKMVAYCDGHDACPSGYANTSTETTPVAPAGTSADSWLDGTTTDGFTEQKTIDWFNCYLRGQGTSDGMPYPVVYQDQHGNFYGLPSFPTYDHPGPASYDATAIPAARLLSTGGPAESTANDGGLEAPAGQDEPGSNTVVTDGVSAPGPLTEDVPIPSLPAGSEVVVGEPHVSLNLTVNGPGAILFFKLVDTTTDQVVDLQTTPIRLDNLSQASDPAGVSVPITDETIGLDLGGVAWSLGSDDLELQITTSSVEYLNFRGASEVSIDGGTVYVPVLK